MFLGNFKRKWLIVSVVVLIVSVFVAWWHWQAPYRVLNSFLKALETGDLKTLYDLTPAYERKYVGLDIKLIQHTYTNYLEPRLLSKYRLVWIQRASRPRYWWKQDREVVFFLWYRGNEGQLKVTAVSVVRPLFEEKWKVPFSYFVYCVAKTLDGVDRALEITRQLGYQVIADPQGSFFQQ